jgi:hypothetical protein
MRVDNLRCSGYSEQRPDGAGLAVIQHNDLLRSRNQRRTLMPRGIAPDFRDDACGHDNGCALQSSSSQKRKQRSVAPLQREKRAAIKHDGSQLRVDKLPSRGNLSVIELTAIGNKSVDELV